jgi:small-conductance mechanosensitive channel
MAQHSVFSADKEHNISSDNTTDRPDCRKDNRESIKKAFSRDTIEQAHKKTCRGALQTLQIAKFVLYIALAVIVIFFLLSIFLGVRDFFPNFIATLFLKQRRSVQIGDKIICDDVEGTVERIGIVKTQVRTSSGDTLFLPNLSVLKAKIKSRKKKDKHRNKNINQN